MGYRAAHHLAAALRAAAPQAVRPAWMLRLGLFIYDHLGGRKRLPPTRTLNLRTDPAGTVLKPEFTLGFAYSDCWVEDSRLVLLNARDAAERGATIAPRTACVRRSGRTDLDGDAARRGTGQRRTIRAKALVNAAGPWVAEVAGSVIRANVPAARFAWSRAATSSCRGCMTMTPATSFRTPTAASSSSSPTSATSR